MVGIPNYDGKGGCAPYLQIFKQGKLLFTHTGNTHIHTYHIHTYTHMHTYTHTNTYTHVHLLMTANDRSGRDGEEDTVRSYSKEDNSILFPVGVNLEVTRTLAKTTTPVKLSRQIILSF